MAELDERQVDEQRVVYTLPGMEQVRVHKNIKYKTVEGIGLTCDVYYPTEQTTHAKTPAVLFIHGLDEDAQSTQSVRNVKDNGQFVPWGQLVAATGLIAVTANHRSTEALTNVAGVANDVDDLITYIRDHSQSLHIDKERLGIWTCSAGAPFGLRAALYEAPTYVRCLVCYYGITELEAYYRAWYGEAESEDQRIRPFFTEEDFAEFSGIELLRKRAGEIAPIFIARAGLDDPTLNESLDRFITEAIAQNVELDVMNHPTGQHGFDILDDDARSETIIQATLDFLYRNLKTS